MTPDDFKPTDHSKYVAIGARPPYPPGEDFTISHPKDPAFKARVSRLCDRWIWSANGRVGTHARGYEPRKRKSMLQAIHALQAAYERCQPSPTMTPQCHHNS